MKNMRKAIVLSFVIALLTGGIGSVSLAETEFKRTKVGDWRAIESAWKYREELMSQEIGSWASTDALNGRQATLGIGDCSRYSVYFMFNADAEFNEPRSNGSTESYSKLGGRIAYATVVSRYQVFDTIFLRSGLTEGFYESSEEMMRADKFLICPTKEEGPRCLTFSLKGFTAALKLVCPKR